MMMTGTLVHEHASKRTSRSSNDALDTVASYYLEDGYAEVAVPQAFPHGHSHGFRVDRAFVGGTGVIVGLTDRRLGMVA